MGMTEKKKPANPFLIPAVIFAVLCILPYLGWRLITDEWGDKYTDEINRHQNHAEWYYLRGCSREHLLDKGLNDAGLEEAPLTDEVKAEREKMVLDDFAKAIELAPDCGPAYAHRAKRLSRTAEERGADWAKVCELAPNDVNAHREYSQYLMTKGQPDKAGQHQKIADELSKN